MAHTFTLMVLTPEQTVFEGAVEYVEVPGSEGYLGVLANHAALVTGMTAGRLTVRKADGATETYQVDGGFFEVSGNRATVLADAVKGGEPKK
jgi:F-type H+-transporting ATPase subunit epsilon